MEDGLSETITQSQASACPQCGGTEYILESGFYFCSECQLQSQELRAEVFDQFLGGQFLAGARVSVPALKPQHEDKPLERDKGKEITSWEALNTVLHGLVSELILLGAPPQLKAVTLQLWASYLMRTEAAFLSKKVEKRPRLNLTFRTYDAKLVYRTANDVINAQKHPVYRRRKRRRLSPTGRSVKSEPVSESSFTSRRKGLIQLSMKKKKLASAEYAASTSQSSVRSELTLDDLTPSEKSEKSYRLHYNKKSKEALIALLESADVVSGEDRLYLQKKCFKKFSRSIGHPTILKLVSILRLALLQLDSDIHLGDLLRWSQEGYLSLLNAEKLIPTSAVLKKKANCIFINSLNSRETINKTVLGMSGLLGMRDLKPRILPLVRRYLEELSLPSELNSFISRLLASKPPKLHLSKSVNYEAKALALILFILKHLFSLDGTTEKNISRFARSYNKDLPSKHLFDWTAWMNFINCRNSVIAYYHHFSREHYHPSSRFGGTNAFIAQWDKIPSKHIFSRIHEIDKNLSDNLSRFVRDFSQEPPEPLPPALQPKSTMLKMILKSQKLPNRTRKILEHDFTEDSVMYLIDSEWQNKLCRNSNFTIGQGPSAHFIYVRPLTGVIHSRVKAQLDGKKKVNVTIRNSVPIYEKRFSKGLKCQEKILTDKRNVLHEVERLLLHEAETDPVTSGSKDGVWSGVGRGYWTYHSSVSNSDVGLSAFESLSEVLFCPDFHWLLQEAASIGRISSRHLYQELTHLEAVHLSPSSASASASLRLRLRSLR